MRTLLLLSLCLFLTGCNALGVVASAVPQPDVKAAYELKGSSVGVMVWADRGTRIEWTSIQLDLASGIMARLAEAQKADMPTLKDVTYPYPAESYVRWQRDHPEADAQPVAQFAPRLNVQKLIYIEINHISTRTTSGVVLYRGSASASVRVFEIKDGKAKEAWKEENISVTFPKHATAEGRLDGNDDQYYVGTIQTLADEITRRFINAPAKD
jgi:hypothetical protein